MKKLFCLQAKNGLIKNDECYTHTHRRTDRLINNGTLYAPRYEEVFCLKAKNGFIIVNSQKWCVNIREYMVLIHRGFSGY